MVADETYQEVSLDPTLVTLQDLRERTTTLLRKFQGTGNLDEFYLEVIQELVTLCDATQLILYAVDRERREFYVKLAWEPCTGRWAEPVPITQDNILGYCALRGKVLNVADAYEATAWATISPQLQFDPAWDEQSTWRTRQLLAIPMLIERKYLMGVLLLINKRSGNRFTAAEEDYARDGRGCFRDCSVSPVPGILTEARYSASAATAYRNSYKNSMLSPLTFPQKARDLKPHKNVLPGVPESLTICWTSRCSRRQDLSTAMTEARRKGCDVETILLDTYRVPKADLGQALSRFYGCPFLPYDDHLVVDRSLLKDLNFEFLKANCWLPLRRNGDTIDVLVDNPKDLLKTEHIQMLLRGAPLRWLVGLRPDILQYLAVATGRRTELGTIQDILGELTDEALPLDDEDDFGGGLGENDSTIVRLATRSLSMPTNGAPPTFTSSRMRRAPTR